VEKNRFYGRSLTHQARNPNELEDIARLPGNARTQARDIWSLAVAEFTSREMHVIKRALAIAALAVERVTERSNSDDANLKALLIKLVKSDVELVMYVREARIALTVELAPAQALSATVGGLKGIDLELAGPKG
jgi:hypothetical protein